VRTGQAVEKVIKSVVKRREEEIEMNASVKWHFSVSQRERRAELLERPQKGASGKGKLRKIAIKHMAQQLPEQQRRTLHPRSPRSR
jgi:tryptophanyl-tRNA synthetase